jgi:hypothetical protein
MLMLRAANTLLLLALLRRYDLGAAFEAAHDLPHAAEERKRGLELQAQYPQARQAYERVARLLR